MDFVLPGTVKELFIRLQELAARIDQLNELYRTRASGHVTTDYSRIKVDRTGETKRAAEDAATLLDKILEARAEYMALYNLAVTLALSLPDLDRSTLAIEHYIDGKPFEAVGKWMFRTSKATKAEMLETALAELEDIYRIKYQR